MVLRTEFSTSRGRVALTDALALEDGVRGHEIGQRVPHLLLRAVEGLEGEVELELEFAPRPEYGLTAPLMLETGGGIVARGGPSEVLLSWGPPATAGSAPLTSYAIAISPPRNVSVATGLRPTNENRLHRSPCSTDSSRNP